MGNSWNKKAQVQVNQAPVQYDSYTEDESCNNNEIYNNNYSYLTKSYDCEDDSFDCSYSYSSNSNRGSTGGQAIISRLGPKNYVKEEYKTKEICALIITINDHNSYDALYQSIEQTPPDPNQFVSVYQFNYKALSELYKLLLNDTPTGTPTDAQSSGTLQLQLKEIMEEIGSLDGENIVINYECCGSCSDNGFETMKDVISMTKLFIERKFVVMFSDFSVKALIKEWTSNDPILGSNPFFKVGEFGSSHTLEFNAKSLIDCDFAQLQNVGELCAKGNAEVHAPGGTILYSVKKKSLSEKNSPFDLKILTVVTHAGGKQCFKSSDAIPLINGDDKEVKGLAGHVVLTYKNGGKILTSCGHWVELIKLDVTKEALLAHAERNYGKEYAANLDMEINSCASESDRWEKIRSTANCEVQRKAPCKYKSSKIY